MLPFSQQFDNPFLPGPVDAERGVGLRPHKQVVVEHDVLPLGRIGWNALYHAEVCVVFEPPSGTLHPFVLRRDSRRQQGEEPIASCCRVAGIKGVPQAVGYRPALVQPDGHCRSIESAVVARSTIT